ncbi:hypothetical protein DPMN_087550 [Dreissena polymorpha]|uniref:Uncharacterized protein n=1 Tax=Dreissena polymorpha TaxID=45954 RepID=A0A9D4KSZ8_DREPO|nr:hypothetical protein DPMN_087550 [Dreissena polymorpha]
MGGFSQLYGEEEAEYVAKLVSENQELIKKTQKLWQKSYLLVLLLMHSQAAFKSITDLSDLDVSVSDNVHDEMEMSGDLALHFLSNINCE